MPQVVTFYADIGDCRKIDAGERATNLVPSRMAPLNYPPDRTLDDRVLLWLCRCRVHAADPGGVAVVDVPAADELSAVVRVDTARFLRVMSVSNLWTNIVVSAMLFIACGRIRLQALSTTIMS